MQEFGETYYKVKLSITHDLFLTYHIQVLKEMPNFINVLDLMKNIEFLMNKSRIIEAIPISQSQAEKIMAGEEY